MTKGPLIFNGPLDPKNPRQITGQSPIDFLYSDLVSQGRHCYGSALAYDKLMRDMGQNPALVNESDIIAMGSYQRLDYRIYKAPAGQAGFNIGFRTYQKDKARILPYDHCLRFDLGEGEVAQIGEKNLWHKIVEAAVMESGFDFTALNYTGPVMEGPDTLLLHVNPGNGDFRNPDPLLRLNKNGEAQIFDYIIEPLLDPITVMVDGLSISMEIHTPAIKSLSLSTTHSFEIDAEVIINRKGNLNRRFWRQIKDWFFDDIGPKMPIPSYEPARLRQSGYIQNIQGDYNNFLRMVRILQHLFYRGYKDEYLSGVKIPKLRLSTKPYIKTVNFKGIGHRHTDSILGEPVEETYLRAALSRSLFMGPNYHGIENSALSDLLGQLNAIIMNMFHFSGGENMKLKRGMKDYDTRLSAYLLDTCYLKIEGFNQDGEADKSPIPDGVIGQKLTSLFSYIKTRDDISQADKDQFKSLIQKLMTYEP